MRWAESAWTSDSTLSYFFNARSPSTLEKSTLGLYRSLIHQLVSTRKEATAPFLAYFSTKETNGAVEDWTEIELQNFIVSLLTTRCLSGTVNIFVDALDEGADEEVRELISFLDDTGEKAQLYASQTQLSFRPLRICLSTRHYPHISVRHGIEIVVEDEAAHSTDIATYVDTKLAQLPQKQIAELRRRISTQSAGVFLWVILVVPMISSIHDRGRGFTEMMKRLDEIPTRLHDLFSDILHRDEAEAGTCIRLLQWVLFSERALTSRELFVAIQHDPDAIRDEHVNLDIAHIARFILDNSRGLVELTKTDSPNVQFIHETVRTYLLHHYRGTLSRTRQLLADPVDILPFISDNANYMIAQTCLQYLLSIANIEDLDLACLHTDWAKRASTCKKQYPLADYAACFWWKHSQIRGPSRKSVMCAQVAQSLIDDTRAKNLWLCLLINENDPSATAPPDWKTLVLTIPGKVPWEFADLGPRLHCAIMTGLPRLISLIIEEGADVNLPDFDFGSPLAVAAYCGYEQIACILLEAGADVHGLPAWRGASPLHIACHRGYLGIAETLLRHGGHPQAGTYNFACTVTAAARTGMHSIVRQVLERIPAICPSDAWYADALVDASVMGHADVVSTLLEAGSKKIWHSSAIEICARAIRMALGPQWKYHTFPNGDPNSDPNLNGVVQSFATHVPASRKKAPVSTC